MTYIHKILRPHQEKTLNNIRDSKKRIIILQAPTGSGKSFFPAQLAAWRYRVLTTVRTKSLQRQYVNNYNFAELFGKSNYICKEYGQQASLLLDNFATTADLCTVPKAYKSACHENCPYWVARKNFVNSNAGTLNVKKFLLDRMVVEDFIPEWLFLDEAHESSDQVVDFSGITLTWSNKRLRKYTGDLEQPYLMPSKEKKPKLLQKKEDQKRVEEGFIYLSALYETLDRNPPPHPSGGGNRADYKHWERLKENLDITLAAMEIEPEYWYVYANDKKLVCKPLTAKYHFKRLFDKASRLVLMSATIGNIDCFTRELGIQPGEYEYIKVPNIWPPEVRPIEDLKCPRLGYKSSRQDWLLHSQIVASRINQCPDHWTGILHSPSKWLARDMSERIGRLTGRPVFIPDEKWGTDEAMDRWLEINNDGTLCYSWQFWEGIDAGKDQISIVCKVPFTDFSDPFERARFMLDAQSGYARTANKVSQALGRTRRGREQDYGSDNGLVAIADGNWTRVKSKIDKDILRSVI